MSFHGRLPSCLSFNSLMYSLIGSSKLRLPAACWYSMPRTVNVFVMLAIRYNASPLTSGISGRVVFRSRAVWCRDHNDCSDEVTSTEKDTESYPDAAIIVVSAESISENASFKSASLGSNSGGGCAGEGSKHLALATATHSSRFERIMTVSVSKGKLHGVCNVEVDMQQCATVSTSTRSEVGPCASPQPVLR